MSEVRSRKLSHSRSRSPHEGPRSQQGYRRRSKSPPSGQKDSRPRHARELKGTKKHAEARISRPEAVRKVPAVLPFLSSPLSKHQFVTYRPLLASYLDIQKQLDIDELSGQEARGRWKSFLGKWNRGELAEGWYDPVTLVKATEAAAIISENDVGLERFADRLQESPVEQGQARLSEQQGQLRRLSDERDEDDDDYGPSLPLPSSQFNSFKSRPGPTIPTVSDLILRDELNAEDNATEQKIFQAGRRAERDIQKQREEETNPRAEAGTRERRLEKRAEIAASNRSFAEGRGKGGGDGLAEVEESELMGNEGGAEEVKKLRQSQERKKNERELRREEMLRARAAEREERLAGLREREEQTMSMLRAIAKERFG